MKESSFDPFSAVTVTSKTFSEAELRENLSVKGKVNTKKNGKYSLTYLVKDPRTELVTTKKITFTVTSNNT